ncbi:MAG: hypothetical protein QOE80_4419 [Actinomycetota bacterium]|nr:hypothetical protein [Actinomycetota bacterium]
MQELPETDIERAEAGPVAHRHDGLDGTVLLEHVRAVHRLGAPDHLSRSTIEGLHDRLHDEADAAAR